jgi:hypothetical protein
LSELFTSGRVIDIILAAMALEAILLLLYRRRSGTGPTLAQTIANLMSGAMIMLAVRSALTDSSWKTTAVFLLSSFAAHIVDLKLRMGARR